MKYFQYIIIGVLIIFIILFNKQCSNGVQENTIERYTDTIVKTTIDTVYFEKIKIKTITKLDSFYYNIEDSLKKYTLNTSIKDSLIEGTINTKLSLYKDSLIDLDQSIIYTPLFPKYIHQIDSIFIKDSIIINKFNYSKGFIIGSNISYNNTNLDLIPTIGYQKNRSIFEVGYSPFSNTIQVGFKLKLGKK